MMLNSEEILQAFDAMGLGTDESRERLRKLASVETMPVDTPREQYFIRMDAHSDFSEENEYAQLA